MKKWTKFDDTYSGTVYIPFCPYCRGRVKPTDDEPHKWYHCPTHGKISIKDVEMIDAREIDQ